MERTKAVMKIESYIQKEGMLLLSVNDYGVRSAIKNLSDLCEKKHGGYVKLEMSPPYRKRTIKENDKWWAMCTEYGRHLGMSKDDVAIGVKYRAMDEGLWESEEVPFSRSGQKRPVSTTKADTVQMSVLIDVLYRIAAEDGYEFSDL